MPYGSELGDNASQQFLDPWLAERHDIHVVQPVKMTVDDAEAADDHGSHGIPRVVNDDGELAVQENAFAEHVVQHVP